MIKFIKSLTIIEWLILMISIISVVLSFILTKSHDYINLIASIVGIIALIFIAKGNPFAQILCIIFAIFYSIISYKFKYYGEAIIYVFIMMPLNICVFIKWLNNRSKTGEVLINNIKKYMYLIYLLVSIILSIIIYFILRLLGTSNLIISTISFTCSLYAALLQIRRNKYYAVIYILNDLILITLWSLAIKDDITYLPMLICFISFLVNDIYGFINWNLLERKQKRESNNN